VFIILYVAETNREGTTFSNILDIKGRLEIICSPGSSWVFLIRV